MSQAADENAIIKFIAPEHLVDCIENDLTKFIAYSECEYDLLFEGELNQIMEYLHSFGNYLHGIIQVLGNCDKIGHILRQKLSENTKMCASFSDFMRNLATLHSPLHIQRTNWCRVKTKFATQLFTFVFDVYEISVFLEIMTDMNTSIQRTQTHHDQCIISHLIEFIASKLVRI